VSCYRLLISHKENRAREERIPKQLRWLNTVFDTCVSFTFFSKTLDLSVAKNGSKQVNNTIFGFFDG